MWNERGLGMDLQSILTVLAAGIPISAAVMLWTSSGTIAERHHSHHDTYVIAGTLTWSLVFAMIFMGALGLLLGWLCEMSVFKVDPDVVLGFFDAFLVVSFLYWLLLRRYKVITYDDRLEVTPFFGRTVEIPYARISAMEWTPSILLQNSRNVRVFVGHRRRALLWGALDLDQILIRIDRFDVLDNLSS